MDDLAFYFREGWHHIISIDALDHQLFILALSAIFLIKDWRQVLVLVTAFTIGHSLTLALSVYDVYRASNNIVEFLIPCTIAITALSNVFVKDFNKKKIRLNYFFALFFGLLHGMGFANAIRFMLAKDQRLGTSLFGFNAGLEAGQIAVVAVILLFSYLVVDKAHLNRRHWVWLLSGIAFIVAIKMIIERIPGL